jgi:hypothetical protein
LRTPGVLANISLNTVADTVVAGALVPVRVSATDQFNNIRSISTTPYTFRIEGATFYNKNDAVEQEVFDFSDAYYILDAR